MRFDYPSELPISAAKDTIVSAVKSSQVVIISGQTGSGKTTQIPKMLLELGRGSHGRQIVHTQPRRLAARTVAERICAEMGVKLGQEVGYQVRFTDESSPHTRLRVVTDGILLAQIQHDPHLSAYDTIVIDEAHERSLNIDFLLGYLTALLPQRPDLKLVITSATIDSEKFQQHFAAALGHPVPIIEVSGRTYPVTIYYEPLGEPTAIGPVKGFSDDSSNDPALAVARACLELIDLSRGERGPRDILVFTSGERDIRDFESAIRHALGPDRTDPSRPGSIEILALYARLSANEQHRVFDQHSRQRIILATNVAETSLTVPGIRYVVDPGTARISRYSKASKIQRLPIEPISQASADQRAGRTGRVADGIAIRLYSEEDYQSRPRFTDPEILRTSLGAVVLHMLSVGVAHQTEDVTDFGFIDPPDTRSVNDGIAELTELGAIRRQGGQMSLTGLGRQLARLPIDVRLGRMIIEAHRSASPDILACVLVIVSFLSLQDPRERPEDKREEADRIHGRYVDKHSDYLTILNIWDAFFQADGRLSSSALRRRCSAEFFNFLRLRQWQDLYGQLEQMCRELRFQLGSPQPIARADLAVRNLPTDQQAAGSLAAEWDADAIHQAMLAGLLSSLGMQVVNEPKASDFTGLSGAARARAIKKATKAAGNNYVGARGTRFAIFPSSPLSKTTPDWVMATDLMETSRLWARTAAAIKPEWAEKLAQGLTKTVYSQAHWSASAGAAVASEKVLLYGLPIVTERSVQWSRINPVQAREFLIRQGLVEGQIHRRFSHDDFIEANRAKLEESQEESHRSREIASAVTDEDLVDFYDRRLPATATSLAALANWWKQNHDANPQLLDFDPAAIPRLNETDSISPDDYPSLWQTWTTDGRPVDLSLSYRYEPGQPDDGITVHVPLRYLSRLEPAQFTWLVPGFRDELVLGLIRSLPKALRVQFVPAPQAAADIGAWLDDQLPLRPGFRDGQTMSGRDGQNSQDDQAGQDKPDGQVADTCPTFYDAFTQAAIATHGAQIHPDLFTAEQLDRLPSHLRMTFSVEEDGSKSQEPKNRGRKQRGRRQEHEPESEQGGQPQANDQAQSRRPDAKRQGPSKPRVIAVGRSLEDLQQRLGAQAMSAAADSVNRQAKVEQSRGNPVKSATLLHQAGASQKPRADMLWEVAYDRLKLPVGRVSSRWLSREALLLAAAPYKSKDDLVADLQLAAVKRLLPDIGSINSDADLDLACAEGLDSFEDTVYRVSKDVGTALAVAGELKKLVSGTAALPLLAVLQSIRGHLASLVYPGFIGLTPPAYLTELPRYLRADMSRLQKAKVDKSRDVHWAWQAHEAWELVSTAQQAAQSHPAGPGRDEALAVAERLRWLYEEYCVSLWAQELGTKQPVSLPRLRKLADSL